jgi:hypothetical protein
MIFVKEDQSITLQHAYHLPQFVSSSHPSKKLEALVVGLSKILELWTW